MSAVAAVFNDVVTEGVIYVQHPDPAHAVKFVEITPKSPIETIKQLLNHDLVHKGAENIEGLFQYRLGGEGKNKTCYALKGEDGTIHCAIYIYKDVAPIETERDLHGNVVEILHEPIKDMSEVAQSMIFYSISNISGVKGMGQLLVRNLHTHLTQNYPAATLSTLSPLRDIESYLEDRDVKNFAELSEEARLRLVLQYLCTRKDGVQKFHLGNGAYIGDIKFNADSKGVHRVMVNYIYLRSSAHLEFNKDLLRDGKIGALINPALLLQAGLSHIAAKEKVDFPKPMLA